MKRRRVCSHHQNDNRRFEIRRVYTEKYNSGTVANSLQYILFNIVLPFFDPASTQANEMLSQLQWPLFLLPRELRDEIYTLCTYEISGYHHVFDSQGLSQIQTASGAHLSTHCTRNQRGRSAIERHSPLRQRPLVSGSVPIKCSEIQASYRI
jgi:hypothetical protein